MTQGLVSIIDQQGRVLFKLVTGAEGYKAPEVALRARHVMDTGGGAERLRWLALQTGFGVEGDHDGSFIVQTPERDFDGVGEDVTAELPPSYREHFADPRWNPRWAQGTAEYVEVVQVNR